MAMSVLNLNVQQNNLLIKRPRLKQANARSQLTSPACLNKIRKELFGPVDREETNRLLTAQIEKDQLRAKKKWDFDFVLGEPVVGPNSHYKWSPVAPVSESQMVGLPVMTVSSAAHVREAAVPLPDSLNSSASSSNANDSTDEENQPQHRMAADLSVGAMDGGGDSSSTAKRLKQTKMTDFCKEKKRMNPALTSVVKKDLCRFCWRCKPTAMMATASASSSSSSAMTMPLPVPSSVSTDAVEVPTPTLVTSTAAASSSSLEIPPQKRRRLDHCC